MGIYRIHRINELLNVLAMTVGMLQGEGVRVEARVVEAGVELRVGVHLCERCKRLSGGEACGYCGAGGAGGDALIGENEAGKSSRASVLQNEEER